MRGDRRAIKQRLGVVPQGMTLDTDLTVHENLVVHARYHDVPADVARRRADELLAFARLEDRALAATPAVGRHAAPAADRPVAGQRPRADHLRDAALVSRDATLGDVFLRLTGHALEE